MRLDRFLCACEVDSRSQVKKILKQKNIMVNDTVVTDGKLQIDPNIDVISYQGNPLQYQEYVYYLFHKPKGCVCAKEDSLHQTIFSYLPQNKKQDLFPVGRLDKDTEGLLIVTNDGAFAHNLLSPRKHVDKLYYATLDKKATEEDVLQFSKGIDIGEKNLTKPAVLEVLGDGTEVKITISEGKYHQVKRMMAAVGKEVLYLKRLSMGKFLLDEKLIPGEYRLFSERELEYVKEYKSGSI